MEKKKVLIIGSLHLKEKMLRHKAELEMHHTNFEVRLPVMDDYAEIEFALDVIEKNIELIKWADEIRVFWDGKSVGTIADWQTAVALDKPIIPIFIEKTFTFANAIQEHFFRYKKPKSGFGADWDLP